MPQISILAVFQQTGGSIISIGSMVLIFAVFYFVLIMPQQKRQKKWQQMLLELKAGDKVITSGGLRGTIFSVKEDVVLLKVPPDGLRLEVARNAIVSLAAEEKAS